MDLFGSVYVKKNISLGAFSLFFFIIKKISDFEMIKDEEISRNNLFVPNAKINGHLFASIN